MLSCHTIDSKKLFKQPDGTVIADLTKASWEYKSTPNVKTMIVVSPDYEMRPDLIAYSVYGDELKYDFILKYNGISNPFSLSQDRILFIPDETEMEQQKKYPGIDAANIIPDSKSNILIQPKTVKDQARLNFLTAKADAKEILPPNVNNSTDLTVKFKDGQIIFGEDVTSANKDNCADTISRARLKEKLLNQKIFA